MSKTLVSGKLVDFYLTDVESAVSMYRTYRLLIKQNELGIYGVFNLIILPILLDERFVFRPRTECAFIANHKGSFFIFCNEFAVMKISIRIRA